METLLKTANFLKIRVSSKLRVSLLASLSVWAGSIVVGSANAQTPVSEFSTADCNLTNLDIPQNATASYFNSTYGLRLWTSVGTHRWKTGTSAVRITGECQNHVIWGISSLIGLNSGQFVEFEHRNQTSSFRPNSYSHKERFSNFIGAPKLRGQETVYFAAQTSPPIGVWKSPTSWAINFAFTPEGTQRPVITRIATSSKMIISAIPERYYHTQDFKLGIVQAQSDGSRIAFTFVYERK